MNKRLVAEIDEKLFLDLKIFCISNEINFKILIENFCNLIFENKEFNEILMKKIKEGK